MYHQDSNYIHAIALHDYSAASYHTAYMEGLAIYQRAKPDGSFIPHIEYADNAMTKAYIAAMKKHKIEVQLVPPSNHRANNAERAVQTFKNHFISSLATCDPLYPVTAAVKILPIANLTLNLLRPSHISGLSAYEEMFGPFDSNRYILHPIGTRVITLDAPENRLSFAPHGVEGFYTGPAMQHYRCHEIYCPHSQAIRISDSVSWLPFERIIPKYATLPEEIFAAEPTPIHPTIANTTHLTSSQGVASTNDDDLWVPLTNSQGANTTLDPPTPATPTHTFCPDDITSSLPTPNTIADHPFSSPSPINAPQANFVHYSKAIRGPDYQHWQDSMNAEIIRLFITTKTAIYRPDLTIDTIPSEARVGNANPVIKKKEDKIDPSKIEYRTRLTFDELKLKKTPTTNSSIVPPTIEPRITASSTIDSLAVKLLYNSIVSDHEAIFSSIDVKDWYLNSSCKTAYLLIRNGILDQKSKILLKTTHLPDNAILVTEVNNVVYGMDDAGRISQLELVNHLAKDDFHMCPHTPGLFFHATRPNIRFTTWADDFGVKSNPASGDFEFLCEVLKKKYPITAHKTATKYLGMTIDLVRNVDPSKDTLTCSMPGFVKEGLAELGFVRTFSPKSPSIYIAPKFGASSQVESTDTSPPATAAEQTHLRTAIGKFRWYGDAVDPILVTPLSKMANQQSAPTQNTMSELSRFLNYVDQFPDAHLTFRPSNMQLHIHSDASYLGDPKSRSRFGGVFTMGPISYTGPENPYDINGPVLVSTGIIPTVVGSATEAEYAGLYLNAQNGEVARQILADLGHPQTQPTEITYDNTTAGSIANKTAKIRRSKAIAMRYHWIQDRVAQKHFKLKWAPGKHNLADFPTKAHPIHHFQAMRPLFISYPGSSLSQQQSRQGVLINPESPHSSQPITLP